MEDLEVRRAEDFENCEDFENYVDELVGSSDVGIFVSEGKTVVLSF